MLHREVLGQFEAVWGCKNGLSLPQLNRSQTQLSPKITASLPRLSIPLSLAQNYFSASSWKCMVTGEEWISSSMEFPSLAVDRPDV